MWVAVGVLGILGALALALGLRGRRVNDHPICRGCGFDVVGLVGLVGGAREGGAGGSTDLRAGQWHRRCPECGRELIDRRICAGARRRQRGVIAMGAILLLLAAGWGGALVWGRAQGFDWNTVKPTWLLVMETRQPAGENADAGMKELVKRLEAGDLSGERVDQIVARILEAQGDDDAIWHASWGDFVQAAFAAGALSAGDLERYAKQAVGPVLAPIETTALSSRVLYGVEFTRPPRAGAKPALYLQPALTACRIGGVEQPVNTGRVSMGLVAHNVGTVGSTLPIALPPGEHEWEFVYDMHIIDYPSYDEVEPLVVWRETFRGSLIVGGG